MLEVKTNLIHKTVTISEGVIDTIRRIQFADPETRKRFMCDLVLFDFFNVTRESVRTAKTLGGNIVFTYLNRTKCDAAHAAAERIIGICRSYTECFPV